MHPDTDISLLAQLHFVAEQTARHLRIWKGQENERACPDFGDGWAGVTPMLRGMYTQRVEYLGSLEVHGEDYEGFVKGLYEQCYAGMDQLAVEMTSCIGFADFKAQVNRFGLTDTIVLDASSDDDDLLYVSGRSVQVKKEKVEPSSDNDDLFFSPGPSAVFLKAEKLEIQQGTEDMSSIPEYSVVPKTEMLDDPFYEEAELVEEGLAMDYDLQPALSVDVFVDIVSDIKRLEIEADFKIAIGKLEKEIQELEKGFNSDLEKIIRENVINSLDRAAHWANLQYPQTVSRWNAPVKEGGLHWQTYRATCRRNGVFRDKNMNKELAEPMLDKIVVGWQRAFEILIPPRFQELGKSMDKYLHLFHKDAIDPQKEIVADEAKMMLDGTVRAYQESIRQMLEQPQSYLKSQQKENSRMISDVIAINLYRVYQECAAQTGQGTLAKMRDIMQHHAEVNGSNVFHRSARGLEKQLLGLVKETGNKIADIIGTILGWASRDYRSALVEPQIRRFSEQQVRMRQEMNEVIKTTEAELQLAQLCY
ncbi:hypothetical protein BO78DRAFT_417847 [Aspergillus sclerotiicarbonarius CBS 121057]|uniref:DUF7605 domain-containing protein n=1 Tax=Aspergillus sclerotiicarbonarius (strain CBS 121057 / IBT 28362) TaxID=1448318 RepID=A0A319ECF0_ASPSB|nr:hypothetical protein BO78DRAFT_417847 [Aspergillus sclerotiicarbonarius CBS 121057]